MISFLAAWLLPLPVVPRMNPLPFMPRVRSMTSGLPLLALTPWNTPPGWHSSWLVKGTSIEALDVVRVRLIGGRGLPRGSAAFNPSTCM